jgi:hypothetical protein
MKQWILAGLVLASCVSCDGMRHQTQVNVTKIAATSAFGFVAVAVPETPDDSSDSCRNCNGTGKTGDGRIVITCPVCKGTGKIPDPVSQSEIVLQESSTAVLKPTPKNEAPQGPAKQKSARVVSQTITVYTRAGCTRCKEWLLNEAPRWELMGFVVQQEDDTKGFSVPWFDIQDGELKKSAGSPLTWEIYSNWRRSRYAELRR